MDIHIENFKNLLELEYEIAEYKTNFLFGMSGSGKSSILEAIRGDNDDIKKPFGNPNVNPSVTVDGVILSSDDVSFFDWDTSNYILDSHDEEFAKSIVITNKKEYEKLTSNFLKVIKPLKKSLDLEKYLFDKYDKLLSDLKAKTITKNNCLKSTSPLKKSINALTQLKNKKIVEHILEIGYEKFDWMMNGRGFIADNKCPYCNKKMNSRYINKLEKMSNLDSKTIKETKQAIDDPLISIKYDLHSLKKFEEHIVKMNKAHKCYQEIEKQLELLLAYESDIKKINSLVLPDEFKLFFPKTFKSYNELSKQVSLLKVAFETAKNKTDEYLKGKKSQINDELDKLGIPYYLDVHYNKNGPNDYMIIHKNNEHVDNRLSLSKGERVLISLVLYLVSSSTQNKKLYIIDDPVSSFDHYRRKTIFDIIMNKLKNKTSLILSHDQVFANLACSSKIKAVGKISYIFNDGQSKANIIDVTNKVFDKFDNLIVERYKHTSIYLQKVILLRMLFEQLNGKRSNIYGYLSKIIHFEDIESFLQKKQTTEEAILELINKKLENEYGVLNKLEKYDKNNMKDVDISTFSAIERVFVLRMLNDKGVIQPLKKHILNEINSNIHFPSALAISFDFFTLPFMTKELFIQTKNISSPINF